MSKKKGERTKLNAKLDELAKTAAKTRDNYTCQKCGKEATGSGMHGSHVIPVSAGNLLRWDTQNIKALCHHCHINWWHKNPLEAAQWFEATFPDRKAHLDKVRADYNKNPVRPKLSIFDLQDIYEKLKLELESYKHGN